MEFSEFAALTRLTTSNVKGDWKKKVDTLFTHLREAFIFDNLVIYVPDAITGAIEGIYARASGRGRSKEADASWGESIANKVISSKKATISVPKKVTDPDRTTMPYMLGVPLELPTGGGALVFIRFGGPEFTSDQYPWALLAASQVMRALEQHSVLEAMEQLELVRRRTQLQDDFIASISHELLTPLGFIKGYTTSLLRSDTSWNPATQREFLTIIDEESDQLVMLINRMLDSARLQSGNMIMDFQPVRLESLLRDVVIRIQGRYKNLEIDLQMEPTSPISADIVRIGQVFNNLFDNAIKYAPGSPIEIRLRTDKKHQVITFRDHGPGIPENHIPYIFDRFYRVSEDSHRRGSGLGLYICRQIIQAHDGQISVKTVPGKGTTFLIKLPLRQAAIFKAR